MKARKVKWKDDVYCYPRFQWVVATEKTYLEFHGFNSKSRAVAFLRAHKGMGYELLDYREVVNGSDNEEWQHRRVYDAVRAVWFACRRGPEVRGGYFDDE